MTTIEPGVVERLVERLVDLVICETPGEHSLVREVAAEAAGVLAKFGEMRSDVLEEAATMADLLGGVRDRLVWVFMLASDC